MTKKIISSSKRMAVWNKTGGKCWYCGIDIQPFDIVKFSVQDKYSNFHIKIPPNTFVVDHIIPLSFGGKSDIDNLAPACSTCNGSKKNKSLEEFRFLRERQLAGMPRFNEEQLDYLYTHGITLPKIKKYIFYFEEIRNETH